jgi:UPF0755 protein
MKFFLIIFGMVIFVSTAFFGSFVWDSFLLSPQSNAQEIVFEIPSGASVDMIAKSLGEKKIITSRFFFKTYVKLVGAQSSLQAGQYLLKPNMSFRSVVAILSHAKANEAQVTIPEGYSREQIGQTIQQILPLVDAASWQTATASPTDYLQTNSILSGIPSRQGLEGYLFPDTYRFRKEADAKTVAETMVLTLMRRLAENEIVVPNHLVMDNGRTFHEVLTLASIVEREVRLPEDMARVAGIFFTRLKIGMALQADSTVNYVTGKKDAAITLMDSQIDSLYNTYKYLGLPPGPISNPGMNAIRAVLHPIDSDDLYYLTTPDGQVIYARTFDEHVQNKYKYLK